MLPKVRHQATYARKTVTDFTVVATMSNFKQLSVIRTDYFGFEFLVELTGIEPVTPWLQTRCSPS